MFAYNYKLEYVDDIHRKCNIGEISKIMNIINIINNAVKIVVEMYVEIYRSDFITRMKYYN